MPAAVCLALVAILQTRVTALARSSGVVCAVEEKNRETFWYFCLPISGSKSGFFGWLRARVAAAATARRRDSSSVLLVVARAVRPSTTARTEMPSVCSATFWWMVLLAKRVSASVAVPTSTSVSSASLSLRIFSAMRSSSFRESCAFLLAMVYGLFREGDADFYVAETGGRCAVTGAHYLLRLSLAAIRRAPQRPVISRADGIAAVPEFRGNSAVAGILDHAALLAAFDFPTDFGRKLEVIALVVDRPGAVCFHQYRVVGVGDQVVVFPCAGIDADIGHPD